MKAHSAGKVIIRQSKIKGSQPMYNLKNLSIYTAEPFRSASRRNADWEKFSNENLKFMLDLLSLHHSPDEVQAANEIQRRILAGTWINLENPPPPLENLPWWVKTWPVCLLWKQRPR
jgi:hypothetical protein